MALQDKGKYCIKCNKIYTNVYCKLCKQCQINYLRKYFNNWTNGNEKIDNFIQERQLEINILSDMIVFEWIPYNQLNDIKEIDKDNFSTISSAKWKDGPLCWNEYNKKYIRESDKE